MKRPELHRLSTPFPDKFVAKKEGASYVNHAIVQQRLLATVGPFDMRVDQVIRGPFDERVTGRDEKRRTWPSRENAVVGVVLTCTFTIDGQPVEVSEVGTPEGYYMADHDGDRLKKAMSDALKRCAMRVGVGLDLWSKGAYVLPSILEKDLDTEQAEDEAPEPDHDAPDPDDVADDPAEVDLSVLERVIAEAHKLGLEGDYDGTREYALQSQGHADKAAGKLRKAIAEKKAKDDDGSASADNDAPSEQEVGDATGPGKPAERSESGEDGRQDAQPPSKAGDGPPSPDSPDACTECGQVLDGPVCLDCELPYERADRLEISAVDQMKKLRELSKELKATVPARRKDIREGKCHPGLLAAFVGWLDEIEASLSQPVGA